MKKKEIKNIFINGPIAPEKIATSIAHHQSKTAIGAHTLFLGQVRADQVDGKKVIAIDFSAQQEMANTICDEIREEVFSKFKLHCMHIYHSVGTVAVGEICFFVFVSSGHRAGVYEALPYLVDSIKEKVPIFGKERFDDQSHQWKENSY